METRQIRQLRLQANAFEISDLGKNPACDLSIPSTWKWHGYRSDSIAGNTTMAWFVATELRRLDLISQ